MEKIGFSAKLVSSSDEITVIQKTIVQNLYSLPIVICDVSEKNPNVMFELGLRLAFDKPTIIIKDDATSFIFDTGVVEHIEYPRDLRFSKVVEFKKKLGEKVRATYAKSLSDNEFSTFLKHFGTFKVSSIDEKEVSSQEYIMTQLSELKIKIDRLSKPPRYIKGKPANAIVDEIDICCAGFSKEDIEVIDEEIRDEFDIEATRVVPTDGHIHILAKCTIDDPFERAKLENHLRNLVLQRSR